MTDLRRFRLMRMSPRDPEESGRAASTLELFFDLVFVIAVSAASVHLHHAISGGHAANGLVSYAMVFFAIWWAWMNFTWFGTSFSTDDWFYRVVTIVQMAGVLVLAAGVGPAFDHGDWTVIVIAYVVMRVAMIVQWLRAARIGGALRRVALTYAAGIAVVQVFWIAFLFLPSSAAIPVFVVLAAAEMSVPVIAERGATTPWHPEHIAERYGCFTLIVLGESLLASADAVIGALEGSEAPLSLIWLAVLALVSTAAVWWIYFWPPHDGSFTSLASSLRYGYGHYVIFAAAGAFSAGVGVEVDRISGESEIGVVPASFAVTIPIALVLLGVWLIVIRRHADRIVNTVVPAGAVLVLLDPVLPVPIALTAVVLAAVVTVLVVREPVAAVSTSS
ncbi:MAG TPA: low temperature requirement protein A [Microbacterium sp.]|nr:low temperature requirement protein A [Microbacterium sp.]